LVVMAMIIPFLMNVSRFPSHFLLACFLTPIRIQFGSEEIKHRHCKAGQHGRVVAVRDWQSENGEGALWCRSWWDGDKATRTKIWSWNYF
jgi:hypothetical protein